MSSNPLNLPATAPHPDNGEPYETPTTNPLTAIMTGHLPDNIRDAHLLHTRLIALEKLVRDKKKEVAEVLEDLIPEGTITDGVLHNVIHRTSTPWKQVMAEVYRDLLPPTKRVKTDAIVDRLKRTTPVHQFKKVDPTSHPEMLLDDEVDV